jgi:hypothetical protein
MRLVAALSVAYLLALAGAAAQAPARADPAAWGSDHVGQPFPEYMHGDECLFCHRNDVGLTWQQNPHGFTMRHRDDAPELMALTTDAPALKAIAPEIGFVLGGRHHARFLKPAGYGKVALLSTKALVEGGRASLWVDAASPAWDDRAFADRCAGCHATAVESRTRAFAAFGLDCVACHGNPPPEHTADTSLVWWSAKRLEGAKTEAAALQSICGQCHLRGGRSRSTGLPYPNTFVAGDNLFRDFAVDLSAADDPALSPADRHVFRNVRDVVVDGDASISCVTCHDVHARSSTKHRSLPREAACLDCHIDDGPRFPPKAYALRSAVCEYDAGQTR